MNKEDIRVPNGFVMAWFKTAKHGLPRKSGVYPVVNAGHNVYFARFDAKKKLWAYGHRNVAGAAKAQVDRYAPHRLEWAGLFPVEIK